jgi:hypothetical protein
LKENLLLSDTGVIFLIGGSFYLFLQMYDILYKKNPFCHYYFKQAKLCLLLIFLFSSKP